MEIKGNIGEEVMVKAVIESVTVRKDEIVYTVTINGELMGQIPEEDITLITKEKKPRAEKKPKAHYQPQEHFTQEPDLMEHAMFEDDPPELYKGNMVYEQMDLEEFLGGGQA